MTKAMPSLQRLKCPERSEPLGFGHLRAFLVFPFVYAAFRAFVFSTGIGHEKEKRLKSEREMKNVEIFRFKTISVFLIGK